MDWMEYMVGGTLGGVSGVIAGQPLDTIKVRMQTQAAFPANAPYRSSLDCAVKMVREEGFRSLYRGLLAPVITNLPLNAITFGVERIVFGFFQRSNLELDEASTHFLTGAVGGAAQTLVSCPAELIKIRLQVDHKNFSKKNTTTQYAIHLVKTRGVRGLYRGFGLSLLRDAPAFAVYFYAYYKAADVFRKHLGVPEDGHLSAFYTMTAGGIAGLISWGVVIPVDTLKSLQQSTPADINPRDNTVKAIFRKNYKASGFRFLFQGTGPVMLRAFPVNAVTFFVFEWSLRLLKKFSYEEDDE